MLAQARPLSSRLRSQTGDSKRWFLAWGGAALVAANITYLLAYGTAPEDKVFLGSVVSPQDAHVYFSFALQGQEGHWLIQDRYTLEADEPVALYGTYVAIGHLARLSGLPIEVTYHGARLFLGGLMLLTGYWFCRRVLEEELARRLAFLLLLFSSGLGWLYRGFGVQAPDGWLPEFTFFYTLHAFPHHQAAYVLLMLGIGLSLPMWKAPSLPVSVFVGLCGFALGWLYPPGVVVLNAALLIALVMGSLRRRRVLWHHLLHLGIVGSLSSPWLLYSLVVLTQHPVWKAIDYHNALLDRSPPLWILLGSLGIPFLLALVGAQRALREGPEGLGLVVAWLLAHLVLLTVPVPHQLRFSAGVFVPMSVLAALGITRDLLPRLSLVLPLLRVEGDPKHRVVSYSLLGLLALPLILTNVLILIRPLAAEHAFSGLVTPRTYMVPSMYLSRRELQALRWLRDQAAPQEPVLSSFLTGNLIPALAGNRVFVGGYPATMDLGQKLEQVARFFQGVTTEKERRAFLEAWDIRWVYYGPRERALGSYDPATSPSFEKAFDNGTVAIFRVLTEASP